MLEVMLRHAKRKLENALGFVLLVLVILTSCSTTAVQDRALIDESQIPDPRVDVPNPPQMPDKLPKVCIYKVDADWGCHDEGPYKGDTIVPPQRWDALQVYLYEWHEYPGRVRASMDRLNGAWRVVLRNQAEIEAARVLEENLEIEGEKQKMWDWWEVGLIGLGCMGAGFLFGAVAASVGG